MCHISGENSIIVVICYIVIYYVHVLCFYNVQAELVKLMKNQWLLEYYDSLLILLLRNKIILIKIVLLLNADICFYSLYVIT